MDEEEVEQSDEADKIRSFGNESDCGSQGSYDESSAPDDENDREAVEGDDGLCEVEQIHESFVSSDENDQDDELVPESSISPNLKLVFDVEYRAPD